MHIHCVLHTTILSAIACLTYTQLGCGPGKCDPNVAAGHPHSCANPNATAGTEQGKCRNDSPACDDDLRCIDNVCIPCGQVGQTCCQPGLSFECNDGIVCDNTHEPICKADCGMPGLPCCDGTCPGGGSCDGASGTCQGGEGVACAGNTPHTMSLVDAWGCVWDTIAFTSGPTAADAQACAEANLAVLDPSKKYHLGPLDTPPSCKEVCKDVTDPFGTYTLCAFSDQELASCELSQCANCQWVDGQCPP